MINLYREVASLLGLELNEEFAFSNRWFRFTEQGLEIYDDTNGYILTEFGSAWLGKIVDKPEKINKIVWKPKVGETYYMPWLYDCDLDCIDIIWNGTSLDEKRYASGFVCRTMKEALELAGKMLAVAKEGKNNG